MKNKVFLHVTLFTLMFTVYTALMWFMNLTFYYKWFLNDLFNTQPDPQAIMGMSLIITVASGIIGTVYQTQMRLMLNGGNEAEDKNNNRAAVWSAVLMPVVFLLVGLLFKLILR